MDKFSKYKNYAFVDSQNLNLGVRRLGWHLDFKRFRKYLSDKYKIEKAFIFIGYIPNNQNLYTALQDFGYILIFKPTLKRPDKSIKGNCDAELVLHTMIEYNNYQKALIITGDGDFYCLVDYLNKQEKLLKLLVPNVRNYSKLLNSFAIGKMDFMNNLKNKLEYKKPS
ncbi:MAG: NYN domain-containing protein [bacterium]